MPSLKCWDSECQLSVSVQSQDTIRSPETYSLQGYSLDVLRTAWVSGIPPSLWSGNTVPVELHHLPHAQLFLKKTMNPEITARVSDQSNNDMMKD